MSKIRIKVNDNVYVRTGKDRAHVGKVLKIFPKRNTVIVEGANIVTKHVKPSQKNMQGGIVEQEAPIAIANVMHVCEKTKKPTKLAYKYLDNGTKVRFSKAAGEEVDTVTSAKNR